MLLHHQPGPAVGVQPDQPVDEQPVQGVLADPDGRIGPDGGEADVAGDGIGRHGAKVGQAEGGGVLPDQLDGPLVDVNRPDRGAGAAAGHGHRDRAVAAAEIEQVAGRGRRRGGPQQDHGPGVDPARREDAPIGSQPHRRVGQGQDHLARMGGHLRARVEVVAARHGGTDASARQGESGRYARAMAPYNIRIFGDPVLKQRAVEVANVDGGLVRLAEDMIDTMRAAPGIGLAAPQVGVQKRLFVYQLEGVEQASTIINPVIEEARGEWEFEEGCLSIPGLYFPIVRPKEVHLRGYDLDGNEVSIEADEVMARAFQHELDHLDGRLLLDLLDKDQRKAAMKELRRRVTGGPAGMAHATGEQRGL